MYSIQCKVNTDKNVFFLLFSGLCICFLCLHAVFCFPSCPLTNSSYFSQPTKTQSQKKFKNYKITKLKNSKCDKLQKLQMWQNSECDKTQKLKMWQNSRTHNVTKQDNSNVENLKKNQNMKKLKNSKFKMWQNSKTPNFI